MAFLYLYLSICLFIYIIYLLIYFHLFISLFIDNKNIIPLRGTGLPPNVIGR